MQSFLLTIFLLHFTHSIDLNCKFKAETNNRNIFDSDELFEDEYSDYGPFQKSFKILSYFYECVAQNLTTIYENRTVTKIIGDHENNDDVKVLTIHLQNTQFLPLNIGDFFKNLKTMSVIKSNVQHVLSGDLSGLENLEELNLKNNPIKQIGHDFFKGMTKLKVLILAECHLKMIDSEALKPLVSLQTLNLKDNDCIDDFSYYIFGIPNKINAFESIKRLIANNCQGTFIPHSFDEECLALAEVKEIPSESSNVLMILTIIILSLITAVLVYALVKIRRELQKGSWNEMTVGAVDI